MSAAHVRLPLSVYLGIAAYAGVGLIFLVSAIVRVVTWEKGTRKAKVPALNLQFGIWLALVGTGVGAILLSSSIVGALSFLLAQLLPAVRR